MPPVKLLVVSDYRSFNSSRPEAEAMIGLKKAGIDVTIMTFPEGEYVEKFRREGIHVIPFHPVKKFDREEIAFIRNELIQGKYDVLQLFNSKAILNGIQAAKKLPVKIVLYRGYTGNVNWYDPTAYLKYLHPRVDGIICLTDSVKRHIDRNPFFNRSKTFTILKGHSLDWYKDVQAADLSKYSIPNDAFVVVSVGNVRKFKGMPYVLRSSHYLPEGLPIHYLLIGNGMDSPQHRHLVAEGKYANNFHFPGFFSDPLPLVAASSVLVLASLGGEAINKSVIEAMSLGVPAIITGIEGNKDLQVPGDEDLVVPVKDPAAIARAIMELYNNPERRFEAGKKAKMHIAQHLNTENTVQQLKKFYERLTGEI